MSTVSEAAADGVCVRLHSGVFLTSTEEASFWGSAGALDGEEMNSTAFTSRLRTDNKAKLKHGLDFHERMKK